MAKRRLIKPSALKELLNCRMSAVLSQWATFKQTHQALAGTVQHYVAEQVLKGNMHSVADAIGKVYEKVIKFDKKMAAVTGAYTNYVQDLARQPGAQLWVEKKYDLTHHFGREGKKEIVALADAVVWTPDRTLHGIDLKAGNSPVIADNNPQLLSYGLGALFCTQWLYPIDKVALTIHQGGKPDTYTIAPDGIWIWQKFIRKKIAEAYELAERYDRGEVIETKWYSPSPNNCRFCKGKAKCPAADKGV